MMIIVWLVFKQITILMENGGRDSGGYLQIPKIVNYARRTRKLFRLRVCVGHTDSVGRLLENFLGPIYTLSKYANIFGECLCHRMWPRTLFYISIKRIINHFVLCVCAFIKQNRYNKLHDQ